MLVAGKGKVKAKAKAKPASALLPSDTEGGDYLLLEPAEKKAPEAKLPSGRRRRHATTCVGCKDSSQAHANDETCAVHRHKRSMREYQGRQRDKEKKGHLERLKAFASGGGGSSSSSSGPAVLAPPGARVDEDVIELVPAGPSKGDPTRAPEERDTATVPSLHPQGALLRALLHGRVPG